MDDDLAVSDGGGDKRPVELEVAIDDGGGGVEAMEVDGGETAVKRRKKEVVNGEDRLKKVAEIVLVLSAMGRMRAGRDPTVVEKSMMAEARAKVVALCEELAPKDIVPAEAFSVVMEDLGLNRLKDRLGFRPPKQSISDRIAFSQRRMEESKAFASQPASYPSQRMQTASGAANQNRGTPPNVSVFSSDKVGHVPVSTGTFQPPTSAVNITSSASTPIRLQPHGTEVRPVVVSPVVLNNTGKDSISAPVVPPRPDRAHLRSEGRPNGPSFPNVLGSSAANQHTTRATPVHLQPQPLPQVNVGTRNVVPGQLTVRIDSNVGLSAPQMSTQGVVTQIPGPVANQTAPGAMPTLHHPGMQFVHGPPAVNHHLEISRLVQRLLIPNIPQRPVWTPPSRDYMNKAVGCQFCKLVISEVENMVVCDACEKGFHLGCLQSYNAKSFPRGEWHCPRCLSMSHGKPFPPKYGRVTRNMNLPKAASNTIAVQLPSEKKVATLDEKMNQPNAMINKNQASKTDRQVIHPNATTNGSQGSKIPTYQAVKVAEPSSGSILRHENEISRNDISPSFKEGKPKPESCPNNTTVATVEDSLSTPTIPSKDKHPRAVKSEMPSSEDRLMSETESRSLVTNQGNNEADDLPTSSNHNDVDQKMLDGVETLVQPSESNGVNDARQCNSENDEKIAVQKNLVEIERVHDHVQELAEASESGLHIVDWVGDVDRIVDGNKFFRSCRINGMVYQLQDYALFRSGNGKLIPLKLQAMWEDGQTCLKWLVVHKCYFPDDLPQEVGRPGAPQSNEVYESTHDSNVSAGLVQGPCEVLPFRKFGEENETSDQGSQVKDRSQPVFIRNWFYDETRRAFCPSAS